MMTSLFRCPVCGGPLLREERTLRCAAGHSYDLAKERSWQVRHDLDFAVFGVPGLMMMNRYLSGDNIHTGTITDGKEWGRESELAYTVQSGTFKDLNMRWRNSTMRRDYSSHEFDENRIFISYPLSLL